MKHHPAVETASFKNANIRNSGTGGSMEILQAAGTVTFSGNTTVENGAALNFTNANMSVSKISYTDLPGGMKFYEAKI